MRVENKIRVKSRGDSHAHSIVLLCVLIVYIFLYEDCLELFYSLSFKSYRVEYATLVDVHLPSI
jgi:hypothetical protein